MSGKSSLIILALFLICEVDPLNAKSRQKRCIVVQKQSGSRDLDLEDDEDDDYRKPQPKDPKPDRLQDAVKNLDAEVFTMEPFRLKTRSKKFQNRLMLRNRLIKNNLYN